jgi:hypothetical protein
MVKNADRAETGRTGRQRGSKALLVLSQTLCACIKIFSTNPGIPFPKRFDPSLKTPRALATQAVQGFFRLPQKTARCGSKLIWIKAAKGLER